MTLASSGTLGFGSRKNQRQNKENMTQRTNQTPEIAAINVPTNAAKIPIAVIASSATSVQKINFSAACVALPLCFTAASLIGVAAEWEDDICKSVFCLVGGGLRGRVGGAPRSARSSAMKNTVYFDLETQKSADEVGGWDHISRMRMSVGVTYSTARGDYRIYGEKQVSYWPLSREFAREPPGETGSPEGDCG